MDEFVNKGLIAGAVYHSNGKPAQNYFVQLRRIVGNNGSAIRIKGRNDETGKLETETDKYGGFSIPFLWNAADMSEGAPFLATLISLDIEKDSSPDTGKSSFWLNKPFVDASASLVEFVPNFSSIEGVTGELAEYYIDAWGRANDLWKVVIASTRGIILTGFTEILLKP